MAQTKLYWSQNVNLFIEFGNCSAFSFSPDVELLFAAEGILNATTFDLYTTVFGAGRVDNLKSKYKLASEINASLADSMYPPSIFECLEGFGMRDFTLSEFLKHIMSFDEKTLAGMLLGLPGKPFNDIAHVFSNSLGASAYYYRVKDYVTEIFDLAENLRGDAFYNTLDRYEKRILNAQKETADNLNTLSPLEYSDKLLHKTMRNRGPFSYFMFSPTLFSRYRAVRYTGNEQFMFFSVRDAVYDNANAVLQLKALSDDTRFRVVALLKERGALQGSDIAREMDITAPTVSHHMRILRDAGIVSEETDGNAKFYSITVNASDSIIETLKKYLG